jgi:MFS transporter, DHA1 family, solute carrier family 18 (vesicular amine transporter), member 1/2
MGDPSPIDSLLEQNAANRDPNCIINVIQRARSSRAAVIVVVALALFTDMILYDVIVPILPAILRRVHQDESLMGLLLAVYAAGLLLFTPIFGVWSDRTRSRKAPMLLGQLGLGMSTFLFIYSRNVVLLMIARFLQGTQWK